MKWTTFWRGLDADPIDRAALPDSAFVDTTVLIPALGTTRATDDQACGPFFEAMVAARKTILIAAPSIAEILRRASQSAIPRSTFVRVVPFDLRAAELLGTVFPSHALTKFQQSSGRPKDYIKYDALIVACALRHGCDEFVTVDKKQRAMAEVVKLIVKAPSDYLKPQTTLPFHKSAKP